MATQVQLRRGTSTENNSFTGAQGELTFDTTNKRVRVHDGSQAGGFVISTADASGNVNIDGTVTADGLTVDTDAYRRLLLTYPDNFTSKLQVGYSNFYVQGSATNDRLTIANNSGGQTHFENQSKTSMVIDNSGDISFYEDTGMTPKMVWKSADERLGIGTSSPSGAKLHISDNAAVSGVKISNTGTSGRSYLMQTTSASAGIGGGYFVITDDGAGADRLVIDSSGNVLVGGSSIVGPSSGAVQKLELQGTGTETGYFVNHTTSYSYSGTYNAADSNTYNFWKSGNNYLFGSVTDPDTSGWDEHMRIDSLGNLLVGLSSQEAVGTNAGTQLRADGLVYAAATSDAHILSRRSTDGSILNFRKDTTTVGSIGTTTNSYLWTGGTNSGIFFYNNGFGPSVGSSGNGALTDGTKDIGASGNRFKDLYLSGGVYLGGTGSANKLDDYEEGTWDPTFLAVTGSFGSITYDVFTKGAYTRIGRVVYITGTIRTDALTVGTASAGVRVSGLPFTVAANDPTTSRNMLSPLALSDQTSFANDSPNRAEFSSNATSFVLQKQSSITSNIALLLPSDLGTGSNANRLAFSGFYFTDA